VGTRKTIPADEIAAAVRRLAALVTERHGTNDRLLFLGIANGGVPFCRRLVQELSVRLGRPLAFGVLNVAFQRDDIGRHPIPSIAPGTEIPGDVEGATVVLVDDVLFSGRTVRAALEEVFSHGRPSRVELAVLVDRGNRRLPIAPDYVGFVEPTSPEERVRVTIDLENPARDTVVIAAPN
jgi:pyrimidine operon attenuation protein / uracil phosphoribosyltransferase